MADTQVLKGSSVSGCGSRCFHTNPKRQRGRRADVLQRPRPRFLKLREVSSPEKHAYEPEARARKRAAATRFLACASG